MKSNNIIIGILVAVVAVMGVAFAAFSTTLNINGTATVTSTWKVSFVSNQGCVAMTTKQHDNPSTGTVTVSGTTATIEASMISPGDSIICFIDAKNEGTVPAIRNSFEIASDVDNEAYTVELLDPGVTVLAAGTGKEMLGVKIFYNDVDEKPTDVATFKVVATYEQSF